MSQVLGNISVAEAYLCVEAVKNCIEDIRMSEYQNGPSCLLHDKLPNADAKVSEITNWLNQIVYELRRSTLTNARLQNMSFGKKSEKIISDAAKAEKKTAKVLSQKSITRSEYKRARKDLEEKIAHVKERIKLNVDEQMSSQNATNRLVDALKRLEASLRELDNTTVVDDPVIDGNADLHQESAGCEHTDEQNQANDQQQSGDQQSGDQQQSSDQQQSGNQQSGDQQQANASTSDTEDDLVDQETSALIQDIRDQKKQHIKSQNEVAADNADLKEIAERNIPQVTPTIDKENIYNPATGENCSATMVTKRDCEVLDESYQAMQKSLSEVIELQDDEGNHFSVHSASCHEVQGVDNEATLLLKSIPSLF